MFCSSLILVAILDSWNPSRSPSWTLFWPALCGPFLPASCRPRVGQWLRCDQWKQPTSTPIFGVLGAPLYLNIHFCQGKPYMNLYGMFTVKTVFFSFLLFPPCKLTQGFHNFCALQKLGPKCYYSLCWLQPVISLYFMDPYIFSKNGGSAALSPHHNCRIDRWMDTVSI